MAVSHERTAGTWLEQALFAGLYVALVAWFQLYDFYHRDFGAHGAAMLAYNAARLAFGGYFVVIVSYSGAAALRRAAPEAFTALAPAVRLAASFFTGAGLWHLGMLVLGYLNLYWPLVALALTAPLAFLAYPGVKRAIAQAPSPQIPVRLRAEGIVAGVLAGGAACAFAALALIKGLYPGGGHDYYTHYFYYYQAVIREHGLWPNEVWYHYFYSKGAGLFFLAILLSDPMAPQLVSLCFIGMAGAALYALARRVTNAPAWSWAAVALFFALYVYTPGQGENAAHGGWGDFEKLHELTAALTLALIWLWTEVVAARGAARRLWVVAASGAAAAAIAVQTAFVLFVGGVLALLCVWEVARWVLTRASDARAGAVACLAMGAFAGAVAAVVLAVNYATTGLPIDQGMLFTWPFADVERLYRWGALFEALVTHWMLTELAANRVPFDASFLTLLYKALRLDLLAPLAVTAGICAAAGIFWAKREKDAPRWTAAMVIVCALAMAALLAAAAGRQQPISFYRFSSFLMPLVLAGALVLAGWRWRGSRATLTFAGLAPALAAVLCLHAATSIYPPGALPNVANQALKFAAGAYSLDDAYMNQAGWAGRMPWGGIYPGARGAYAVAGRGVPITSLHVHSYCMLPGCRIETWPAFIPTRDYDRVMFGPPEEARAVLQAAGRNYFLYSKELQLTDAIVRSPLMRPENIARYLGVKWSDGTTVLLTWRDGEGVTPLDADWLAAYRKSCAEAGGVKAFPYEGMHDVFSKLRASPHPWKAPQPPW